ncbi:MAG: hypothetical protein AAF770_03240 [Bacteroidota bacterium]
MDPAMKWALKESSQESVHRHHYRLKEIEAYRCLRELRKSNNQNTKSGMRDKKSKIDQEQARQNQTKKQKKAVQQAFLQAKEKAYRKLFNKIDFTTTTQSNNDKGSKEDDNTAKIEKEYKINQKYSKDINDSLRKWHELYQIPGDTLGKQLGMLKCELQLAAQQIEKKVILRV